LAWNCGPGLSMQPSLQTHHKPPSNSQVSTILILARLQLTVILPIAVDASLPPSKLIQEAINRSCQAHLFHLYPVLCDIAAIPRKSVTTWTAVTFADPEVQSGQIGTQLDARQLAREALEKLGGEMGLES
jgi:hypothetical protein